MFVQGAFGWVALIAAGVQLWRPNVVAFGTGLVFALLGLVLYNTRASALAVALLVLSLARPCPKRGKGEQQEQRARTTAPANWRCPSLTMTNSAEPASTAAAAISAAPGPRGRRLAPRRRATASATTGPEQRGKGKVLVARIEHQPERHMDGGDHGRGEQRRQHDFDDDRGRRQ